MYSLEVSRNHTIYTFCRQVRAEKEAVERAAHADTTPKKDYSLKEGQTINITIGNVGVTYYK
jgi:hypothetical protein